MEVFCRFLEASGRDGSVQRFEALVDLGCQRSAHLARPPGASAGAGGPGIVEQQRMPLGRILDLGKAVAAGNDALNRQQKQAGGDRLAQKTVKSGVAKTFALFGTAVGGQSDDAGRQAVAGVFANALPGGQAVHVRHVKVHQHDVESPLATAFHGLEAAARKLQGSHLLGKRGSYEIAVDFVVVHRQHGETFDFPAALIVHGPQYNPMTRRSTTLPFRSTAMPLAAACWLCSAAHAALQFELEAGATAFGKFSVDSVRVWQGQVTAADAIGIAYAGIGAMGDLSLRCEIEAGTRCSEGRVTWNSEGADPLSLGFERRAGRFALIGDDGGKVEYSATVSEPAELAIQDVTAAWMPSPLLAEAGLADLSGRFSGTLELDRGRVHAEGRIRELAFDTPEGFYAGAGLALDVGLDWLVGEARLGLDAEWSAGELLLGPAYLPSPESPFTLAVQAQDLGQDGWRIEWVTLEQAGSISLAAAGRIVPGTPLNVALLDLEVEQADLATLWRQGLDSVAGTRGWGQLDPDGRLTGRMRIEENSVVSAGLRLSEVTIADEADRLAIMGLGAWLGWDGSSGALELGADWQDARLLRIPLGASAVAFRTDAAGTLALVDSFRLPVLDGALIVERLAWRDWAGSERRLAMDARLEPVDLSALTRALGWTEFGGRLSGNFPGIQLSGSVIEVQGGLDLELFGGSARINGLSVERPFGSLPALAADIEFDSLDLEQVTGAFEFGRMLGLLSGHVRDLRLLDWQPVRFDAWFETLQDSPEREISQKAVDSISSLSGGGGAAISGTLLRWFDDFPYRKAGLGCRLEQNVCRMRGLRDVDNGGYMILEGRLIPRLDIVGYQRRVDWPRLLAQLAAATESTE